MSETSVYSRPDPFEVPDGGLASFLTADIGDWADDDAPLPSSGVASVKRIADDLAKFGRYEDTYVVHAAQGETVIPMAVFEENPRLKDSLFRQMRSMGIDPDRYVVGSELNSINPITGQPEFFLKKLGRAIKKAVKGVVKVIKKVAPIVLSIGLSMTPLGLIAGSALGGGIGTLIQGGSLKDALKMGAISGLTAGLFKGVAGGIQGAKAGTGFGAGFKSGVASGLPGAQSAAQSAAQNTISEVAKSNDMMVAELAETQSESILARAVGTSPSASGAPVTAEQAVIAGMRQPPAGIPSTTVTAAAPAAAAPSVPAQMANLGAQQQAVMAGGAGVPAAAATPDQIVADLAQRQAAANVAQAQSGLVSPDARPGFRANLKDAFVDTGAGDKGFAQSMKDAFLPKRYTARDFFASDQAFTDAAGTELGDMAAAKAAAMNETVFGTGIGAMAKQYGPLALAGTALMGATGGFKAPELETEMPFGGVTGQDLLEQNPELYRTGPLNYAPRETTQVASTPVVPYTRLARSPETQAAIAAYQPRRVSAPVAGAAQGGIMDSRNFPRRNGAINGPGTGTSDDIPAMLSDGEFVFTAKAVRGAGGGDRDKGIRKMYQVMRQFEGVA
jgi:hypothetical protein